MKSSVDNDGEFELDTIGRSEPVETGESICNMLRATETGDRPSCRIDDGLETVEQAGRKTVNVKYSLEVSAVLFTKTANLHFGQPLKT